MVSAYIDPFSFLRATHGLEVQSLIGNVARFTTAQSAGTNTLTVPAVGVNSISVPLGQFDQITIFDGANTEVVQVGSAGAAVGATSIPLLTGTSLQFNHAIGVAWCSDGVLGSLADEIVNASAWLEHECYQSLLLTTYTSEQLTMPGMRASVNNRGSLTFRPRHFPVNSISALSITTASQTNITYDVSMVSIDGNKRNCIIRVLNALPGQLQNQPTNLVQSPFDRNTEADVFVTYSAGYASSALPGDVKEAAVLLTSDILAKRLNPVGAPELGSGTRHMAAVLRGDNSGESLLYKRAKKILNKYSVELL